MSDDLKAKQEAGQRVEKKMLAFLVAMPAAGSLKLDDAKYIAGMARRISFDEFAPEN